MDKILILKDSTLAGGKEFIAMLQTNSAANIIELAPQELALIVHSVRDISKKHRAVLIALGRYSDLAWQMSLQIDTLKAVIIIHPQELTNYLEARHAHPCMIIHRPQNSFITQQQLTMISRPRPDIAQFVSSSDNLIEYQQEIIAFIKQYLQDDKQDYLVRIIRCTDIGKMLPAPNPGAIRVLEENNVTIGIVVPDINPPFEHINPGYKNEIHFVVSGSAKFRHGNTTEKIEIHKGDFVYVKAFEKHEWTDWSDDFKLVFIQWEVK